jgi:hypothetical protein
MAQEAPDRLLRPCNAGAQRQSRPVSPATRDGLRYSLEHVRRKRRTYHDPRGMMASRADMLVARGIYR